MAKVATREPREVLSVREAAEFLGVCDRQIYRLKREGLIPHVKIGKLLRFRRQGLLDWLESQEMGA